MNDGGNPSAAEVRDPIYAESLSPGQRADYDRALALDDLTQEIALLRVRLKAAANDEETDLRLLAYVMNTLVRALVAQYRLSPKARKGLADNITAVLNSLGDQLLPADG